LLTAGHWKEAEQRVLEALELIEEDPHLHTEGVIYDSLGYAYTLMGQHIDAERFLRKSARILESLNDKSQLVGTLLHLSELYQSLRRYETARLEAARALALATEIDSEPLRIEARDRLKGVMLGQLHEGLGNRLKAYRRFRYRIYGIERSEGQGGPWTKG
jgi:tetratricopeptide (TPR) repeat protein